MAKLSSRPPASSLSRRLAQLGLVVASLGLCFAAGEILARWLFAELSDSESFHEEMLQKVIHSRIRFDPKLRSHDPILGYRYPPQVSFEIHRDEFSMHVRTNAHGFRAPEPRPKDIDEYRVLLLGDSLFFTGVEIRELVSTDLARLMKSVSRGRRTSVYNYSVPGYNTIQELLVARMFHPELAADDVVLGVFLGNDPVANGLAGIDAQGAYQFDEGKLTELRARLRHCVRWLPPSTLLRKIVKEIGGPRIRYGLALEPAAIDRTLSLVLQIREVVGQTDARLTVLLIPSRSSMSGPLSIWMRSREFGDRLRSALTGRGVQTIDLLEIFLADPDPWRFYYPDDGHFTAQGHAAVAEVIFKAVAAPQLLRASVTRDRGDSGG